MAEGNFGDTKFKTYYIPLKESGKYLNVTIYDDINNLKALDEITRQIIVE